jgi:hypothetical protein
VRRPTQSFRGTDGRPRESEAEKAINIVIEDIITALKQGQRVKHLRLWHLRGLGSPGAHRPQSQNLGIDSDFRQPLGEVQTGQAA